MAKQLVASWETSCGKHFLKLYQHTDGARIRFYYDTRTGGGNVGNKAPTLEEAVKYLEAGSLKYMKDDH